MTSIDDGRLPQPLPPHIKDVLETMFAAYKSVVVKHEFSEGFSGSRVFLVRPILENGRPELPSVVKIDEYDRIEKEWEAYTTCIENRLPSVATISGDPVYPRGSQYGGLRYPLAGDGAFDVISLQAYCQQASIGDMRYVFGRLFKSLGKLWEQKTVHAELHLAAAYDSFLPPNLLLEWTTVSTKTAVSTDSKTAWLHPETYQQQKQSLEIGDIVQVAGFQITRIWRDSQTIALDIPADSSGVYQIRCQTVPDITICKVGQIIHQPLTCRVIQTRMGILQEQAAKALGKDVDLTAVTLPVPNREPMLNPLIALPELLNQSFDVHTSCIHSDLHLGNVLVEPESGNIHLIDFVNAGEFQLLRDFLNLELATVTRVLPSDLSDPQQIIPFYEQLHCALHYAGEVAPPEGLERPFSILFAIRQAAQNQFFKRDEWREYYSGLVVYLLGSLRYGDLDGIAGAKQIAFWGATAVLNLLENGVECDEVGDIRDVQKGSSLLSMPSTDKVLDVAIKREIEIGVSTVLLVLIHDSDTRGLRVLLDVEPDYGLKEKDVRSSRTFQLDFPMDEMGNLLPTDIEIVIHAPNFSPPSQSKIIRVDTNQNNDVLDPIEFLLTPLTPGELQIIVAVYQVSEGVREMVRSKPMRTMSMDNPSPYVKHHVMSLMFHILGKESKLVQNTTIYGDMVQGDKVEGDKVGGDEITVSGDSKTTSNATYQENRMNDHNNSGNQNQTIFHGPVSGSIHTGSGDINIINSPQIKQNQGQSRSGISTALHSQIRTTLLDCASFTTDRELKAIFVDNKLRPWHYRLPQADNHLSRVDMLIDFLHNQYNAAQENALVLLLRVLSERLDVGDACHHRLATVAGELEREVK